MPVQYQVCIIVYTENAEHKSTLMCALLQNCIMHTFYARNQILNIDVNEEENPTRTLSSHSMLCCILYLLELKRKNYYNMQCNVYIQSTVLCYEPPFIIQWNKSRKLVQQDAYSFIEFIYTLHTRPNVNAGRILCIKLEEKKQEIGSTLLAIDNHHTQLTVFRFRLKGENETTITKQKMCTALTHSMSTTK